MVNFINFCRVFIPVSTGAKTIEIDQEQPDRVIIKNKVTRFYGSRCIVLLLLITGK